MKWTLRGKLAFLVSCILALSLGVSSFFLLRSYSRDKQDSILSYELSLTRQLSSKLDHLLFLAGAVPADRLVSVEDVVFVDEGVCSPSAGSPPPRMNPRYVEKLKELGLDPQRWRESFEVYQACRENRTGLSVVPSKIPFFVPYLLLLTRSEGRNLLILLSMDGFRASRMNTLFLGKSSTGEITWRSDGTGFFESVLRDLELSPEELGNFMRTTTGGPVFGIRPIGKDGLIAFSRVGPENFLYSLSYRPALFRPLRFAIVQAFLLLFGICFLGIVLGRQAASVLMTPLEDLRSYSEFVGAGDFTKRLTEDGISEIATVKKAMNSMSARISRLMEEVKDKFAIAAELALAQQVQTLLLPAARVKTAALEICSSVKSATECGGDWWGWIELARPAVPPATVVFIGDVTGHGTGPALVTAAIRGAAGAIEADAKRGSDFSSRPESILEELNALVFEIAHGLFSMTFLMAVFDESAGRLTILNAGHNLPYLITRDAEGKTQLKQVGKAGTSLGYAARLEEIGISTHEWKSGSKLFLYTDGLIDCVRDGVNLFDRKHLRQSLDRNGHEDPAALIEAILRDRGAAARDLPQADDITAILCKAENAKP